MAGDPPRLRPAPDPPDEATRMSSGIGPTLRSARREQQRSLKDASLATRIRETYLAALEVEDFDALGEPVYVRGFIASYAKYLGVDPKPLLEEYRDHHEVEPDPLQPAPRPILDRDVEVRRNRMIAAVVVTLIVGALVLFGVFSDGAEAAVATACMAAGRPQRGPVVRR